MYTHAVLAQQGKGDYYTIITGHIPYSLYAPTLEQLHEWMERLRLDVLWIMPGTSFSQQIRKSHFDEMDKGLYDIYVPEQLHRSKPPYGARISFNRKNAFPRFIMFPEHREWKVPHAKDRGIWYTPNPETLLTTISYLQEEYKTNVLWSPSHISMDRLKEIHRVEERNIQPLPQEQEQRWEEISKQCCNWIAWATKQPIEGKYIIGYDKNAQYTGAAQSVRLGNGGFKEVDEVFWTFPHSRKMAGFWNFKAFDVTNSAFDETILPFPFTGNEGYAHTDLINAALDVGIKVKVLGGIIWQESDKYLASWAKEMWNHRHNLNTKPEYDDVIARNNAASTAKMIPNTLVGLLARTGFPHWNRSIVHRAVANQVYTLNKLYRDFGVKPILVSKDAFYIAIDTPFTEEVIPGFLAHKDEQRGYKEIGITLMNSTIQAAFERVGDRRFGVAGIEGVIRKEMKG